MEKKKPATELIRRESPRVMSPFSDMERMMEDLIRRPFSMFPAAWPRMGFSEEDLSPAVDIFEQEDSVIVKAELPGLKKEDISVELNEGVLRIAGEKKREEMIEKKDYYRMERSMGSFERRISLPSGIETDKTKASFKDGVLEIQIPKSEEAKRRERKIKIE
ncbi:MAG TPA: Hsp20/alpha crystallin family protein [Dissulfurispiraceae bacterium]|nr:Hsp20/alpha crystallin family protein [Dissulfurispiraceae bacterium]